MLKDNRSYRFGQSSMLALTIAVLFVVVATPQAQAEDFQIGLIDMAHVFKNYEKFKATTSRLQAEVSQSDDQLQPMVEKIKNLQEQMKALSPTSSEYEQLEGQMVNAQADLRKVQLQKQREFMKKESELYKEIYLEIADAVDRYSRYYNYTLILRFNRAPLDSADEPEAVVQGMNRQVLYHRNSDDLTDPVLTYLNGRWQKQQAAGTPAGTTR